MERTIGMDIKPKNKLPKKRELFIVRNIFKFVMKKGDIYGKA